MKQSFIPVSFNRTGNGDSRFAEVEIWLMHMEKNHNKSWFDKSVVMDAIPTLADTPILGFIEERKADDEPDFSDHRSELEKKDGKWKAEYKGRAFGTIPADCNPRFQMKKCDDGVEREFLVVTGKLWKKWDDAIEIFERDGNIKSQSMEIVDCEGYWEKSDKLFHFTKFSFFGACILGDGVQPAMQNSTIEMFSKDSELRFQFQQMAEDLKLSQRQINNEEGGGSVDEKLELVAKFSMTKEAVEAKGINFEEISLEELEAELTEFSQTSTPVDNEDEDEEGKGQNFSLTANQMEEEISRQLSSLTVSTDYGTYPKYWMRDHMPESNTLVAYDSESWSLVGLSYAVEGDKITVDFESAKRFKVQYVPMELGFEADAPKADVPMELFEMVVEGKDSAIGKLSTDFEAVTGENSTLKEKVQTLEGQVTTLTDYKKGIEDAQRTEAEKQLEAEKEAVFATFDEKLTEEEMAPVREKITDFSVEQIQDKLFAIVGKKVANFSTTEKPIERMPVDAGKIDIKFSKEWEDLMQ